ncbi:CTP synthase 2, partial [Galemys pyrenaicus]
CPRATPGPPGFPRRGLQRPAPRRCPQAPGMHMGSGAFVPSRVASAPSLQGPAAGHAPSPRSPALSPRAGKRARLGRGAALSRSGAVGDRPEAAGGPGSRASRPWGALFPAPGRGTGRPWQRFLLGREGRLRPQASFLSDFGSRGSPEMALAEVKLGAERKGLSVPSPAPRSGSLRPSPPLPDWPPKAHCEVFVLNDGGEVDLDLGNYERFLDINLYKDNNITTGKIYQHVINKERRGDFLGKTVQVVPHITDAVQDWVMNQAMVPVDGHKEEPQICLGGTIGDIEGMPFVEAFRQFQFKAKRENFCNIHVSLVPQVSFPDNFIDSNFSTSSVPSATGEQKTKPTQNSVRALRGLGLSPDLIVCRSSKPIEMAVKEKISMFCHVDPEQVICIHDVSSTYRVPVLLEEQGIVKYFKERLDLPIGDSASNLLFKWRNMADRYERLQKTCSIALVGKYTKLRDCYASVFKALEHSALAINHKLKLMYIDSIDLEQTTKSEDPVRFHEAWQKLCKADGVLVPGGFGIRGTLGKLQAISWARSKKIPFLGVCLGMQLAVIEFARNCLDLKDADSTEFEPNARVPVSKFFGKVRCAETCCVANSNSGGLPQLPPLWNLIKTLKNLIEKAQRKLMTGNFLFTLKPLLTAFLTLPLPPVSRIPCPASAHTEL